MLLSRRRGAISHHRVGELPGLLRPGDLLVLNDTRCLAARVPGRRRTGGRIEMLFVRAIDAERNVWDALVRGTLRPGEEVTFPEGHGRVEGARGGGRWAIALDVGCPVAEWLDRVGSVPLPPYIRRPAGPTAEDRERYQTVVARHAGAVAAPTAGLHFTTALLAKLAAAGIPHATITLHVGPGTFLPIRNGALEAFEMEAEAYEISPAAVDAIGRARDAGGRVVAVGTTTCRALESAALEGALAAGAGWARLFIRPGHAFRVVDALMTNFHLPKTPLLALVAALTGWPRLRAAYETAVRERYRFYSYGDAMVIL